MNLDEITVEQKTVFKGRIVNLRVDKALLPNGEPCEREVVEHPGGVCVVAMTDQDEILFVRQFRYPYGKVLLEIPAGKLSPGEDPLDCGKRELREETGAVARQYVSLGTLYPSPGYCGEIISLYFARVDRFEDTCPDEDEFLEIIKIPLAEAVELVLAGEIPDAKTALALLKTSMLLDRGML